MSIIAKAGNKEFSVLPMGNYQAVCFDVWDVGLQKGEYKGETIVKHQIIIAWETDEVIKSNDEFDGKRYRIYGWYTLSLGLKANLRRDLTSWRGKDFTVEEVEGFDVEKLVGANCMLNIIHDKKGKARVSAVTSLPKSLPKIIQENRRDVPEWIKKLQAKAITEDEADAIHNAKEANETEDTDKEGIPF